LESRKLCGRAKGILATEMSNAGRAYRTMQRQSQQMRKSMKIAETIILSDELKRGSQ